MHFRLKNNRLNCTCTLDIAQKSGVKPPAERAKNRLPEGLLDHPDEESRT
jgi:hypothetical protein